MANGDLDLFAVWQYYEGRSPTTGWLMALNDGQGALELRHLEEVVASSRWGMILEVLSADLTGDGQDEIAISINNDGQVTEVWSIDAELQVEVLVQIKDRWLRDVADWDGDGRVELFVGRTTLEGSLLEVWDVAEGVWTVEEIGETETHAAGTIGDLTGDGVLDVLWEPIAGQADRLILAALGEDLQGGEVFEFDEWKRLLGVGDFDGDGQVDLLTELLLDGMEGSKGLALQQRRSGDRVEASVLYDARLFRGSPVLMDDLNADGGSRLGVYRGRPRFGLWGVCRMGWQCPSDSSRGAASAGGEGDDGAVGGYGWGRRCRFGRVGFRFGVGCICSRVRWASRRPRCMMSAIAQPAQYRAGRQLSESVQSGGGASP